jgi:Asp-tRNA(Asn)/Glu-tRNA(Gln) amidotransferase B subunit
MIMMKIEISIEKGGEDKEMEDEELSPEQIAEMVKKLKTATLTRKDRKMLSDILLQEESES